MAQRTTGEFALGGALILIWGIELLNAWFAFLTAPFDSLGSVGVLRDYVEYLRFWMAFRCVVSAIGMVAGITLLLRRRIGHWLNVLSAGVLLLFATDFHWYASWASGKLSSSLLSFFVTVPGLAYGVLVFPAIVIALLAVSGMMLAKGRNRREVPQSAI